MRTQRTEAEIEAMPRSWTWGEAMRWHDVVRAHTISGVIPDNSYASMMKFRAELRKREQAGQIRHFMIGRESYYQLLNPPTQ
jgi:hypothetical protein